jgi:hypothetical protein
MIYLNPVLRHDGEGSPLPAVAVDGPRTWLLRASFTAGAFVLLQIARRRPRARPSSAQDQLGDVRRETA